MKLFVLPFVFFSIFPPALFAQEIDHVFQEDTPVIWLGLDFSQAKFIGDTERLDTDEAVFKLINSLNVLMIGEAEKYDIGKAFRKNNVSTDLHITIDHNKSLDVDAIRSTDLKDMKRLGDDGIQNIVAGYNFGAMKGLGLMFIIESFSKPHNKGSIFVTFVDLESKQVLLTERFIATPQGFGLRNYWAGAIYTILKSIRRNDYHLLRRKYTKL